jgi:hypothetical protein
MTQDRRKERWSIRNRIVIGACIMSLMGAPALAAKDHPAKNATAKAHATEGRAAKDRPAKKQTAKKQTANDQPAKDRAAKPQPGKGQPAKSQPKEEHPLGDPEALECIRELARTETLVYEKVSAKLLDEPIAERANELLDEADALCDEGNHRRANQTLEDVTKLVSKEGRKR